MIVATSFLQDHHFIEALYIVAFVLFISGLRGLAGPRTAPMGNRLAAVGMFIAFVATLLIEHVIKSGSDVALMMLNGIALPESPEFLILPSSDGQARPALGVDALPDSAFRPRHVRPE